MNKIANYLMITSVMVLGMNCTAPQEEESSTIEVKDDDGSSAKELETSSLKVAFIYGDTINAKYDFLKDAEEELDKERKVIEDRINRKLRKAEERAMELQQQAATMTQLEVQEAQLELQNLDIEIQQFQEKLASDFRKREIELQEEYTERVNKLLDEFNADGTYDIILNFQPGGNLLWINDAYDITKPILSKLNEDYQNDLAKNTAEGE